MKENKDLFIIECPQNRLVASLDLCRLIPDGNFEETLYKYELMGHEDIDDKGNVLESQDMLSVCYRIPSIDKVSIPESAEDRLKLLEEMNKYLKHNGNHIHYTKMIYPAPTLAEILERLPSHYKVRMKYPRDDKLVYSVFGGGIIESDMNAASAALKVWLKLECKRVRNTAMTEAEERRRRNAEACRKWRARCAKNKEKHAEACRKWRERNKEKQNEYMRQYLAMRRKFGAIKDWTEWHPLPFEILSRLSDKNHRLYCEWWCKAHPLNMNIEDTEAVARKDFQ